MDKKINFEKAVEILNDGGIIIFPTDTAYGVGCRIDDGKAVVKLNKMLKRPKDMASPVLFDTIERVEQYVELDSKTSDVANKYWPGALTLILRCNKVKVLRSVRGGRETLGVRIPNHETPLELIKHVDKPIIGTSANFHGGKTPYLFSDLDKRLIKLVDYVLEGKTNERMAASTVVDCTVIPWKIIRQGEISLDL